VILRVRWGVLGVRRCGFFHRLDLAIYFGISETIFSRRRANGSISDIAKSGLVGGLPVINSGYSEMPVLSLQDLGRIIREKRKAGGLRIDDAAALCGVSVDLLSRLENGKSGVATDRVLKVLDALGLAMLVLAKDKLTRA